uniref:Ig-like domain-containing protein n=1 Tax=Romanomermis culicivorax TaxID=13658 RepID=A0A915J9R2_ROMCU
MNPAPGAAIFHEFEGDQVTFVCPPGGDHTNAYYWYHGYKLLSWDIKRDLTIRNMTRSHAGNYECLTTPGSHTAAVKSKIYDVVGASMDDTGKYSCEIQYFNMVFKSPELEITIK